MNHAPPSQNNRELAAQHRRSRATLRAALFGLIFGLGFSLLRRVAEHATLSPWLKVAFIAVFALTLAFCFSSIDSAYLDTPDELEKKIRSDAASHALPMSAASIFALGALDLAGLPLMPPAFYWLPIILSYGIAGFWAKRRYA